MQREPTLEDIAKLEQGKPAFMRGRNAPQTNTSIGLVTGIMASRWGEPFVLEAIRHYAMTVSSNLPQAVDRTELPAGCPTPGEWYDVACSVMSRINTFLGVPSNEDIAGTAGDAASGSAGAHSAA